MYVWEWCKICPGEWKDVTIPAHKSIVVLHSKYLQDLLLCYNDDKDDVLISVSEASYQDMKSVLELMYLGQTYIEQESG